MRLLALATSGPFAAVGLWTGVPPLVTSVLGAGAERGRGVTPAIAALLEAQGLAPKDLEGIAVDIGPGSFTGVRVGVATAKALAMGLGIPLVGVVSLSAVALSCGPSSTPILALRDARAGEAYFALYEPLARSLDEEPVEATTPPMRISKPARGRVDLIRRTIEERGLAKVMACGEDAERLAVTLPLQGLISGVRTPTAGPEEVLRLAIPRFLSKSTDDPDALAPSYLQPSTPERRLAGEMPPG